MPEVTSVFERLLVAYDARINKRPTKAFDTTDEFLKEAYRINSHIYSLWHHLSAIRASYLSINDPAAARRARLGTASEKASKPLTNAEREDVDAVAKSTIRDVNAGIRQLEDVEFKRRDTRTLVAAGKRRKLAAGFGALGRWATAGGTQDDTQDGEDADGSKQVDEFRDSVVWYLRAKLEMVASLQADMMERRLEREKERGKSMLGKSTGYNHASFMADEPNPSKSSGQTDPTQTPSGLSSAEMAELEATLPPQQLQLFAEENNSMLQQYNSTLAQIETAQSSLMEISNLQSTLAQNLEIQAQRIDSLVDDSQFTELNVTKGNKELQKATERWFRPARFVFWASCGLAGTLITWDLIF